VKEGWKKRYCKERVSGESITSRSNQKAYNKLSRKKKTNGRKKEGTPAAKGGRDEAANELVSSYGPKLTTKEPALTQNVLSFGRIARAQLLIRAQKRSVSRLGP